MNGAASGIVDATLQVEPSELREGSCLCTLRKIKGKDKEKYCVQHASTDPLNTVDEACALCVSAVKSLLRL